MEEVTVMDSNPDNPTSSDNKNEEFKQVAAILTKLFALLTTLGVAVKTSDTGQEFLTKHFILMNGLTLGIVAFFLVQVPHTMLHQRISTSFFATLLLLVLGTVVSVLELSLISWTISLITLALWLVVFIWIVMFKCEEFYKPILTAVSEGIKSLTESLKQWIENYWF